MKHKNRDKKMNTYFKITQEKINIFHNEKQGPEFKYVNITHAEFNQNYCKDGWMGRKVMALPKALWSGTIKTLYYLAQAIIARLVTKNSDDVQIKCFYAIRELEKSLGWFISLFHDRTGQFYVQESQFYQARYDSFLLNKEFEKIESLESGNGKDKRYQELAQIFLSKGDLGRALKAIHLILYDQNKKSFIDSDLKSYINTRINKNKLYSDLQLIDDEEEKEKFIHIIMTCSIKMKDINFIEKLIDTLLINSNDEKLFENARDLFIQGLLDQASKIIKKIKSQNLVDLVVKSSIRALIDEKKFDSALEIAEKFDFNNLEEYVLQIARIHSSSNNLHEALRTLAKDDFYEDEEAKKLIINEVVQKFYNENYIEDHLWIQITKIKQNINNLLKDLPLDSRIALEFKGQLAVYYCQKNDLQLSLEIIDQLDSYKKQIYLRLIAQAFTTLETRKAVFYRMDKNKIKTETLEGFLKQVIAFYDRRKHGNLLEEIFSILPFDNIELGVKDSVYMELIEAFLKDQKPQQAYEAAVNRERIILISEEKKYVAYLKIIQFCHTHRNIKDSQDIINKALDNIVRDLFRSKLILMYDSYDLKMKNSSLKEEIDAFFKSLVKSSFEKIKDRLVNLSHRQTLISEITAIVWTSENIKKFRNIEENKPKSRNDSNAGKNSSYGNFYSNHYNSYYSSSRPFSGFEFPNNDFHSYNSSYYNSSNPFSGFHFPKNGFYSNEYSYYRKESYDQNGHGNPNTKKTHRTDEYVTNYDPKLEQAWITVEKAWQAKKGIILRKDKENLEKSHQEELKSGRKLEDSYVPLPELNRKMTKENFDRIKRVLLRCFHSDKNKGDKIANQNFIAITNACDIILPYLK
jgi:hypothetical protein